MSMKSNEERVLKWCNKQRVKRGLERLPAMVKGSPGSCDSCPIAKMFAPLRFVHVDTEVLEVSRFVGDYTVGVVALPAFARQFVHDFDRLRYPHLLT